MNTLFHQFIHLHPTPIFDTHHLSDIKAWLNDCETFIDHQICQRTPDELSDKTANENSLIQQLLWLRTQVLDTLLIGLFNTMSLSKDVALFAVGGFGRGEVFPFSDVDLLIIYGHVCDDTMTQLHEFMAFLWDTGINPALTLRSIDDDACVKELTIATSLAENRFLAGDDTLQDLPTLWTKKHWTATSFFDAKMIETYERHQSFGKTEYNLEPNVKSAVGGLRDIHLLYWIGRFYFSLSPTVTLAELVQVQFLNEQERDDLVKAKHFFWQIRHHLHVLSGKADDKLSFGAQKALATRMGFGETNGTDTAPAERLMKQYYHHAMTVATLSPMLCELFFETYLMKDGHCTPIDDEFVITKHLSNHAISVRHDDVFDRQPQSLLRLFLLMGEHNLKHIAPQTIRLLRYHSTKIDDNFRQNPIHRQAFIDNLNQDNLLFHRLRLMKRTGILGAYLPAFAKITGLMQYDLFHRYTVDAHTLLLIRLLHRFDNPNESDFSIVGVVYRELHNKLPLVIASIFHDIAKGQGGDHSELGASLAKQFCQDHQLNSDDTDLIEWLVRHHLVMSITAQKKDIDDPAVIGEFAQFVGDIRHLDYLYVLTVADMNATNSQLWNNWRATLLRQLYLTTHRFLNNDISLDTLIDKKQQNAKKELLSQGIDIEQITHLWQRLPYEYFTKHQSSSIAWHTQEIQAHQKNTDNRPLVALKPHPNKQLHANQLLIYTPNQPNLFAVTVSILDKFGYSIYGADILTDDDNYALDSYVIVSQALASKSIVDGQAKLSHDGLTDSDKQRLIDSLSIHLTCPKSFFDTLPAPRPKVLASNALLKHFNIPTDIYFEPIKGSYQHNLHLITKDKPSLLAKIGRVFGKLNIWVHSAKITTLGERVEDIFCVSDEGKSLSEDRQHALKDALMMALDNEQ